VQALLAGDSVIDWHRLEFDDAEVARSYIRNHEIDPDNPGDRRYLERIQHEAVSYLRRNFSFAIPKPVENAPLEELLRVASGKGHRQMCACTILKALHIINHMQGRELLFRLPVSDRDLFHLVEDRVYRVVGSMLTNGFPITEFVGGRKNLDSTYTKLLSKSDGPASTLYDKLRFRIVTRTRDDILPILLYLTERLFPVNCVVPAQSTNTIFHFRSYCESHPHLRQLLDTGPGLDDGLTPVDNRFTAPSYRVIQFVTDVPVRVPRHLMESAPAGSEHLGPVVYMICEFQVLDAASEAANEQGEASHEAYKTRQRRAVASRLRMGSRGKRRTGG
jgi:uncharacterized protein (TIGR04552 family)